MFWALPKVYIKVPWGWNPTLLVPMRSSWFFPHLCDISILDSTLAQDRYFLVVRHAMKMHLKWRSTYNHERVFLFSVPDASDISVCANRYYVASGLHCTKVEDWHCELTLDTCEGNNERNIGWPSSLAAKRCFIIWCLNRAQNHEYNTQEMDIHFFHCQRSSKGLS